MTKRKGNSHRADWWDKAKASQPVETTTTPVEQIRQRAEATHLDYPHSRAVSDVTILLAEWDDLQAENERLRAERDQIVEIMKGFVDSSHVDLPTRIGALREAWQEVKQSLLKLEPK